MAAKARRAVVATHIRLAPRVPDPEPQYDDVVQTVADFLLDRAQQAEAAGIPRERIMVDAGLDLGKTEPQSLELLRASDRLAELGYPLLLSASNKRFLGHLLGTEVTDRTEAIARRPRPRHRRSAVASLAGPRRAGRPPGLRRDGRRPGGRERPMSAPVYLVEGRGRRRSARRRSCSWSTSWSATATASLLVDEFAGGDYELAAAIDAAQTLPFLTDRRVVVARHVGRFSNADGAGPAARPTWPSRPTRRRSCSCGRRAPSPGRGWPRLPPKLKKALEAAGAETIDHEPPARQREDWVGEHFSARGSSSTPRPAGSSPSSSARTPARSSR